MPASNGIRLAKMWHWSFPIGLRRPPACTRRISCSPRRWSTIELALRAMGFAPSSSIPAMPTPAPAERGLRDAEEMARLAAAACDAQRDQALVLSTGIIGEFLPMEKIAAGIDQCGRQLGASEDSLVAAARGMMTTDTTHKLAGRTLQLGSPHDSDHRHGQRRRDDRPEHGHHAWVSCSPMRRSMPPTCNRCSAPWSTTRSTASASMVT